jgi:hypothetical protein
MVNAVTDMYSERVTTPMHSIPLYLTNVSGSNINPGVNSNQLPKISDNNIVSLLTVHCRDELLYLRTCGQTYGVMTRGQAPVC